MDPCKVSPETLQELEQRLGRLASFDADAIKQLLVSLAEDHGVPLATLNAFLRRAITGTRVSYT